MAKKSSKAYELEIKIAGAVAKSLGTSVSSVEKHLNRIKKAEEQVGKYGAAASKAIGLGLAATAAGAVAAGKYLYDLGAKFDDAVDTIRIGTGATGADLEALNESMKNVYASVPADMADTASAISDYNTRLGLTGKTLETLSSQALQASGILGEDLGGMIESSSQAFQQWKVSEADMAGYMDYIFKVSQSTGIGMNDLFSRMQTYGPQLQNLGYSFKEAAALIGQMEKAGVNTDEALAAMKKSVGALAKEGISASKGLQMYYDKIKGARTQAEAVATANEVFGARAGSTIAAAIRDGTLAVDDFVKSLDDNQETISGAAWDTYDFAEKFELMKHEAEIALAPLADVIFNSLSDVLPVIGTIIEDLSPMVQDVLGTIDLDLISNLAEDLVPILSQGMADIAPILAKILPQVMSIATRLAQVLLPVLGDLISNLLPAIEPLIEPILQIIMSLMPLITALMPIIVSAVNIVCTILRNVITFLTPIIDAISFILTIIAEVGTVVFQVAETIGGVISNVLTNVLGFVTEKIEQLINLIIGGINWVIGKLNSISIGPLPDWDILGEYAGAEIGFNIPELPELALAEGGVVMGPTNALVGEGGEPEVVAPLSKLPTLLQDEPEDYPRGGTGAVYYVTFAPVINCDGGDEDKISEIMDGEYERFKAMMDQYVHDNDRVKF